MKNILITGITGQDGIFLTSEILKEQEEYNIFGITRNPNNQCFFNNLNSISNIDKTKIKLLSLDLTNFEKVNELIKEIRPSFVYNLSGPSSVYESLISPNKTSQTITNIFDNLTNSLIRESLFSNFFQASSSEMYGIEIDKPLTESHSFSPKSPYAKAKLVNHKKVIKLSEDYNWKIFSGIMFNHESEFRKNEYLFMKIINEAIKIKDNKSDKLVLGSLDYVRDWSYAKDISKGIYKIANEGKASSYVLGSGKGRKIQNIVEIVFDYFNLNVDKYVTIDKSLIRKGDPTKIIANPSRIKEDLNWSTEVDFEDFIRICINSRLDSL
ncbi:MAG: GDP-mannose 4,6-dehydratase [Pelagibacterales bacterium]|nr:GDP-mannose 4,6-dehydratase [Pelagibacterales bacterium]|tara:strand:- start:304 stop:1278 length:975 start_codon:yes stop_codon:yes gene_type:complete